MDPEGARLLTYCTERIRDFLRMRYINWHFAYLLYLYMLTVSPACRLYVNIHHYAPPRIVLHPAAGRQCTSEG